MQYGKSQAAKPVAVVADTVKALPADTVKKDTTKVAKPDTTAQPKASVATPAPIPAPAVQSASGNVTEEEWARYQRMDARVRTGAYRIIGTSQVVKVKAGDTVERIAKRTLGPDMSCYIEVYNGIKATTPLEVGQEVKIPKIELKKKKKKVENQ